MPFCKLGSNGDQLYYRTYGQGSVKVLLIIGLAGMHNSWTLQIRGLTGTDRPNDDELEAVADQNLGRNREQKSWRKMQLICWITPGVDKAHIFGHWMGGMIACKLAAMVPDIGLTQCNRW